MSSPTINPFLAEELAPILESVTKSKPARKSPATPATPTGPNFAELTIELVVADQKARGASADSTAARSERSGVAIKTVIGAFNEGIGSYDAQRSLLDAGVLKGTASKMATILRGLHEKLIYVSDLKSLSGSYALVKAAEATLKSPSGLITAGGGSPSGTPYSTPVTPVSATTPEQAIDVIVNFIRSITDPDEAFRVGGEWITITTNRISAALKSIGEADDEGEGN